jgi:hypothetical protein
MLNTMETTGQKGISPVIQPIDLHVFIQQFTNRDKLFLRAFGLYRRLFWRSKFADRLLVFDDQESKKASREKAKAVVAELRAMKLKEAAKKVAEEYGISPKRSASLLDTFSCIFQGILPYGAQMLVAISTCATLGYAISAFDIIPLLF